MQRRSSLEIEKLHVRVRESLAAERLMKLRQAFTGSGPVSAAPPLSFGPPESVPPPPASVPPPAGGVGSVESLQPRAIPETNVTARRRLTSEAEPSEEAR